MVYDKCLHGNKLGENVRRILAFLREIFVDVCDWGRFG